VLWIHGFGANFYFAPYLRLARALAACGIAVAVVNTRGHDLATLLWRRGHSLGATKVTHYLAERQDRRVLGLALAAPPLQHAWDTRAYPAAARWTASMTSWPPARIASSWAAISAARLDFAARGHLASISPTA
jgi:alpha-beta hydrolase superfamily lysophospholipase